MVALLSLSQSEGSEKCLTHPWLNDSEQVFPKDKLLGKAIVIFRMKGNAKEAHDARMRGQIQGDTVLLKKAPQLR